MKLFQLTHPWGCDFCLFVVQRTKTDISTHTPVRVWLVSINSTAISDTFQLTHPWGCDFLIIHANELFSISTHTPVRVWHNRIIVTIERISISTHTPVRVWLIFLRYSYRIYHFNSHTREGVTVGRCTFRLISRFQLTHPWGCDQLRSVAWALPRQISTHTPVRVWPYN